MRMIEVRLFVSEDDLLDAAEDVERLLADEEGGDLSPAMQDVLFALDDAVTTAVAGARVARG